MPKKTIDRFYQVLIEPDRTKAVKIGEADRFSDKESARKVKAFYETKSEDKTAIVEFVIKTKEVK